MTRPNSKLPNSRSSQSVAHVAVDGVYPNKAPGGVAYRCSFRVTEAAYCIERAMDILAQKLGMDPAELRLKNFIRPEQFPYENKTGWTYDSGDYEKTMREAMRIAGYEELRKEQAEKRERGVLMNCTELIAVMAAKGYQYSPAGKTPHARQLTLGPPSSASRVAVSANRLCGSFSNKSKMKAPSARQPNDADHQ